MTRLDAIDMLLEFMYRELGTPRNDNPWKLLRGDRICSECRLHRRSTLYMLVDESSPLIFHCFRASCGKAEVVTQEHLVQLGFQNEEAIKLLLSKDFVKSVRTINLKGYHLVVRDHELIEEQINYLSKRLGYTPSTEELSSFRIIPNIKQVIEDNQLVEYNPSINEVYKRMNNQKTMITFTNSSYDIFSCRSITSNFKGLLSISKDKKFMGYDLKNTPDDNVENLIIAEGIFDILNIKKYFAVIPNSLYLASCGFNNTIPILKYYYRKYIESVKRIIIFLDSDEFDGYKYKYKEYMYNTIKRSIRQELGRGFEFYIIYNSASKDFGDMSKPIKPIKEEIK